MISVAIWLKPLGVWVGRGALAMLAGMTHDYFDMCLLPVVGAVAMATAAAIIAVLHGGASVKVVGALVSAAACSVASVFDAMSSQ